VQNINEKTTQKYWEDVHSSHPRLRLPSNFIVSTRDLQKLLTSYIKPQMHVLEIGCAPGKQLAYVGKILKAKVSGVDFSERGINSSQQLFEVLGIEGDLRCENIFSTSFKPDSFDLVYSRGVIEHFDDPTAIVRRHVELLRPAGIALIIIPNYHGIYGRLQSYFDPENLLNHNLNIMTSNALIKLAPDDLIDELHIFPYGRLNPWLINFNKKWPPLIAKAAHFFLNFIGMLQPFEIKLLCSTKVLKLVRTR